MPWVVRDGFVEHQHIGQQQFFLKGITGNYQDWRTNQGINTFIALCKSGLHLQLHPGAVPWNSRKRECGVQPLTLLVWGFVTSYAAGQNFSNMNISLNFKLQEKDQHIRSVINSTVSTTASHSGHHMVVKNSWTEFWWTPLLSKTPENKTRGLCMGKSYSHVWSVPFFQYFFFLTVIFPLIYLNQSPLISRPKTIPEGFIAVVIFTGQQPRRVLN